MTIEDALALAVAKSEAERIMHFVKQFRDHGIRPEQGHYLTHIETSARRIVAEIDSTNK